MCRCFCMRKAGFVTFMCVCNQFSYWWRITTPLVLVMSLIMLVLHTLVFSSIHRKAPSQHLYTKTWTWSGRGFATEGMRPNAQAHPICLRAKEGKLKIHSIVNIHHASTLVIHQHGTEYVRKKTLAAGVSHYVGTPYYYPCLAPSSSFPPSSSFARTLQSSLSFSLLSRLFPAPLTIAHHPLPSL